MGAGATMGSCMRPLPFRVGDGRGPEGSTRKSEMANHNSRVKNMAHYPISPQVDKAKKRQDYEYVIISENEKSEGLTLGDYLAIIKRRRWLIIFPLFITIPIALLFIASDRPVYKATTRLQIEQVRPPSIILEHEVSTIERARDSRDFYNTQFELIKGRAIAEEVVRALQLDKRDSEEIPRLVKMINAITAFPGKIIDKTIT